MNVNVLNTKYEKITIVDDFTSLMWCKRYADVGALDLEIEATTENLNTFKEGYYITRDDDDTIYRIESLEIESDDDGNDKLIVGALDCKCILHQRITWDQVFLNNSDVQAFIKEMLTFNFIAPSDTRRRINLRFDDNEELNGIGIAATRQSTYDDIGEKVIELCKTYDLGCKVYFNYKTEKFHFSLYKGVDRSINQSIVPRIVFSPENDNIFSNKYSFDVSQSKNVALVGGEGEGLERKLRSVGTTSGLNRREVFIDASSAKDESDLVDYFDALINEGKAKLSEMTATKKFEGEIDNNFYRYKYDYDLGDIVTIKNKYGVTINARIIEIIETWDNSGYTIEPVYEYIEPDVDLQDVLFTEMSEALKTEDENILIIERSPFITENEENEIITEDGKLITLEN